MNLDHLKQVAQAATQGPWEAIEDSNEHLADCPPTMEWLVTVEGEYGGDTIIDWGNRGRAEDAKHIATFDPPTALALITRIEELEATIQRVRDLHPPRPNSMSALYPTPLCACGKNYPCPTTQSLEGDPNA